MINGVPVDVGTPAISLFDRGFLYADGVFEVLRTYEGRPHAIEDHLSRMLGAATSLGIGHGAPAARWLAEVGSVLAGCTWPESVLRLVLTRGIAAPGVRPRELGAPTRVVMAYPLPELPPIDAAGVTAITLRGAHRSSASSGLKTLEYLTNIVSLLSASGQGADEAILLDGAGRVIEASTANVLVVSGGALIATPPDTGLPGITQTLLIEAAALERIPVQRRPIAAADLWTADEIALCSSVRGLVPVLRVDEHEVSASAGAITLRLHERYQSVIRAR